MARVKIMAVSINDKKEIFVLGMYVDEPGREEQTWRAQISAGVLLANYDRIGTIIEVV